MAHAGHVNLPRDGQMNEVVAHDNRVRRDGESKEKDREERRKGEHAGLHRSEGSLGRLGIEQKSLGAIYALDWRSDEVRRSSYNTEA